MSAEQRERIVVPETGNEYLWRKVPRWVLWRHGRISQTFNVRLRQIWGRAAEELSGMDADARREAATVLAAEKGLQLIESMTPPELESLQAYVDDVLAYGLSRTPDGVAQLPEYDYWYLFNRSTYGAPEAKVETTGGDTDAAALENFSDQPGLQEVGADVSDVPPLPVGENGPTRPAAV